LGREKITYLKALPMKNLSYLFLAFSFILLTACGADLGSSNNIGGGVGQGGSLARFTISGNHLYAVNGTKLKAFDIATPNNLRFVNEKDLNVNVETIFSRDDSTIFIGTQSGMYIYDISDAPTVKYLSSYQHIVACDPVVANSTHAYVTLHTTVGEGRCWRGVNQLDIVDITDLKRIQLVNNIPMTSPKGLGLYGDTLLVCDEGIRIFDITDGDNPVQLDFESGIDAIDIIPNGDLMLIATKTGLEQYRYHNGSLSFLSRI
jgi:hypothetical protein